MSHIFRCNALSVLFKCLSDVHLYRIGAGTKVLGTLYRIDVQ